MKLTLLLFFTFTLSIFIEGSGNKDSLECIKYFNDIKNETDTVSHFSYTDTLFAINSIKEIEVHFNLNKFSVREDGKKVLDSIKPFLIQNPSLTVCFEVYTDLRGSEKYNQALSSRRSKMMQHYISNDSMININRVLAKGFGESYPIITQEQIDQCNEVNEYGYAINRRTYIRIIYNDN